MTKYFGRIAVFALTTLITACGGGGSSESASTDNAPPPGAAARTLAGHVLKGIVQSGLVTIEEIDTSGEPIRELAREITTKDGEYFAQIPEVYGGGPVRVTVSGTSGITTMICDAMPSCGETPFGDPVPLDESFSLVALLPRLNAETNYVQVNPFTDLAASRASELGDYTATNIASAQSEVDNLFAGLSTARALGINLANNYSVTFAGASDTAIAVLSSSIAKIATSQSKTIPQVQAELRAAFTGGSIVASDSNGLTFENFVDALEAQFIASGLDDDLGLVADLRNDIAVAKAANLPIDPIPSTQLGGSDIETGRQLVSDARSIGYGLIENRANASRFVKLIDYARSPAMKSLSRGVSGSLADALAVLVEVYNANNGADGTYANSDIATRGYGSIELSTLTNGDRQAVLMWPNLTVDSSLTLTFSASASILPTKLDLVVDGWVEGLNFIPFGEIRNKRAFLLQYNKVTVSVEYEIAPTLAPGGGPNVNVLAAQFKGPVNVVLDPPYNPRLQSESGIVLDAELEFSYAVDNIDPNGNAVYTGNFALAGTSRILNMAQSEAQFNLNATTLRFDEADGSMETGTVTASFSMVGTDGQSDQVTVAADLAARDSDGDYLPTGTVSLTHNGKTVRIFVEPANTVHESYNLTIENAVGAKLRINDTKGEATGSLTVNGNEIGVINRINGLYKITYIDGTFETLN